MSSVTTNILFIALFLVLLPTGAHAFGAGDIPDFAYLNDKAFRHGDIENILGNLAKTAGKAATGGGLLGLAHSVLSAATGGAKFNKGDIKKVYFGNWLRDYSQAMDIGGLSKLSADTLVLVVSVLGFMTFGFATEEFKITPDRLGVYLPVEHIDNPKGYSEKEGDARHYHPKLRPPVDPRELEIDPQTGMKNYIATENQSWDTSTAHIRRTFRACIDYGRRARGSEGADLWEAYRLLGTGLHTMEDLLAHSNWCELTLRKMGHQDVFCHVGDSVLINTPNGPAPPLVTGTFGGADFLHSLMGEATDKISQASVTDLSEKMNSASQDSSSQLETLKGLVSQLPIGGSAMDQGANLQQQSKAYNFNPDNIAPPEVQQQLTALLTWHDSFYRDILKKIEAIPGLTDVVDNITNALNAYVYSILAPWLSPILQQATVVLGEGSKAVIDNDDQYEVFNNPNASDPSHSLLSKDHFGLILNEPAGKIAQLLVENTVNLIVDAWFDDRKNPDQVINQILEAFHHPYYATGRSRIQQAMYEGMEKWLGGLGPTESEEVLQSLTKESVRNGKNKRKSDEDENAPTQGGCGHTSTQSQYGGKTATYGSSQDYSSGPGESDSYSRNNRGGNFGYNEPTSTYGSSGRTRDEDEGGYQPQRNERYTARTLHTSEFESFGGRPDDNSYQSSYDRPSQGYDQQTTGYGRGDSSYGRNEDSLQESRGYSGGNNYGSSGYGRNTPRIGESSYEQPRQERSSKYDGDHSEYGRGGYGGREETSGYRGENEDEGYQVRDERRVYGGNDGDEETFGTERLSLGGEYGGGEERRDYSEY